MLLGVLGIPNCSLLLCSYAWETLDVFLDLIEDEATKLYHILPLANSWFGVQVNLPSGTLSKLLLWGVFTLLLDNPFAYAGNKVDKLYIFFAPPSK